MVKPCYAPVWLAKTNTKTYQYDLLRPSLVSNNQHEDLPVRFVTPQFGQQKPAPRLTSTICYAPVWSATTNTKTYQCDLLRPSLVSKNQHQDLPVRFVTPQFGQQKLNTKTYQHDLLRPSLVSKNQHQDLPVRFVTPQLGQQKTNTKTYQYDLLRPSLVSKKTNTKTYQCDLLRPSLVSNNQHQDLPVRFVTPQFGQQKPTPRLASTICYAPVWSAKTNTKTYQYDLLRPSLVSNNQHQDLPVRFVTPQLGQQKPTPRLTSTICYAPVWSAKTRTKTYQYDFLRPSLVSKNQHQDLPVRFVTPQFGQQKPTPRLTSAICYAPVWSATTNTKTYQYDLLRPSLVSNNQHQDLPVRFVTPQFCQQQPTPRLTGTICYAPIWSAKTSTKTYQYDLLRPSLVSKNQHQDLPVRFVTPQFGQQKPTPRLTSTICCAPVWSAKTNTKTYQYDLLRPSLVSKKPTPRLTGTICYAPVWSAKTQHQDLPARFVTPQFGQQKTNTKTYQYDFYAPVWSAKTNTKTYQCDLLRPSLVSKNQHQDVPVRFVKHQLDQQQPTPRLTSTICYAPVWSAKNQHQDLPVRFVTVSKNQHQDLPVRFVTPQLGQQKPTPRLTSTICYAQFGQHSQHRDLPVRFVTPQFGQQKPIPRLASAICYAPVWSATTNTKTYQYDLLRARLVSKNQHQHLSVQVVTSQFGQQKPTPRLTSAICYAPVWSAKTNTKTYQCDLLRPSLVSKTQHQDLPLRFFTPRFGHQKPTPRLTSTSCYAPVWSAKTQHQDLPARFVTPQFGQQKTNTKTYQYDFYAPVWSAKTNTKTYQCDLLRPSLVSKNQHQDVPVRFVKHQLDQQQPTPRLTSTICYAPVWSAKNQHQDLPVRFVTVSKNQHQDLPVRFVTPQLGQQKPTPRLTSTICYAQFGQHSQHRDLPVRFVTPQFGQQKPIPRLASAICYAPVWSATTNTKTYQYDLLRARLVSKNQHQHLSVQVVTSQFGQQKPTPRLTSAICYAPVWSAKTNTKTYQCDLLRPSLVSKTQHQDLPLRFFTPRFGHQKPTPRLTSTSCYAPVWSAKKPTPRLTSTICYAPVWSATTNTKTYQYDLLCPSLVSNNQHQDLPVRFVMPQFGQQKPTPRLTSTICYAPIWSAKTNTKTYQYDLLRPSLASKDQHQDLPVRFVTPQFGQQKPTPRLTSTICYAPVWSAKTNTKTCQYDLLRPSLVIKDQHQDLPVRLVTVSKNQHQDLPVRFVTPQLVSKNQHQDLPVRFVTPQFGHQKSTPRLTSTICYAPVWSAKNQHQDLPVRFVSPQFGQQKPTPRLTSTICYAPVWSAKANTKTYRYDLLRPSLVSNHQHQDLPVRFVTPSLVSKSKHQDLPVRFVTPQFGQMPEDAKHSIYLNLLACQCIHLCVANPDLRFS